MTPDNMIPIISFFLYSPENQIGLWIKGQVRGEDGEYYSFRTPLFRYVRNAPIPAYIPEEAQ